MNKQNKIKHPAFQIVVFSNGRRGIDDGWLNQLIETAEVPVQCWHHSQGGKPMRAAVLAEARRLDDGKGQLFLRSGLQLPANWLERLAAPLEEQPGLARIPAGNYADQVNPLAGIEAETEADPATLDRWLWLCSEHRGTPIDSFPLDCVYFPPGSAEGIRPDTPALLIDSLFVFDPERAINSGNLEHPAANAALGPARLRLKSLAQEGLTTQLPAVGLDGSPVTLHITHSWGGGVARWINDVVSADLASHHLVLASSGHPNGKIHGQSLQLYAAGADRGLIRELPLTPAIADSVVADSGYRQILDQIIARFGVSRLVISSLIGHSLDALRTGLPTAQILHDFYPAWPLLDQDPLHWLDPDGQIDLARALASKSDQLLFDNPDPAHWKELLLNWQQDVRKSQITLIAPSSGVLERWQTIVQDKLPHAQVVGHGFSHWPITHSPVVGSALSDGRLNLVVLGRISPGKGLKLLDQSLSQLSSLARITLVGCGIDGLRFFGRPGVDIVLDYDHARLPQLMDQLQPQAALFLSTVPETWSYTLSEARSLGIQPVATRLGSFAERIDSGRDGWLFDPEPEALVQLLTEIKRNPHRIQEIAAAQPAEPSTKSVVARYWTLVPSAAPRRSVFHLANALSAGSDLISAKLCNTEIRLANLERDSLKLERDLAARTAWAGRYERLSKERTEWARSLERDLAAERQTIKGLTDQLDEITHSLHEQREALEVSEDHLRQTREHLAATQQQVDERTHWAQSLEQELQTERRVIEGLLQKTSALEALQHGLQQRLNDIMEQLRISQNDLQQRTEELANTQERATQLEAMLAQTQTDLQIIFNSRSWRWTRPLRFFNRLLANALRRGAFNPMRWPRLGRRLVHHLRFHGLDGTLHLAQGLDPQTEEREALPLVAIPQEEDRPEPLSLVISGQPVASIIIPVFNKLPFTAACLRSLADEAGTVPFEVIVVDDCSTDATGEFLTACSGLTVVRNARNSGFIASCNAGANSARGEFLVFLNNDTTVTAGWLEALLDTFGDFPQAGIVGARLAYPDGRLQEAGGIIFNDASGWNYGRNESPDLPQYNFTAEADYVSGACLAIRRELFERLGGFDTHYAPAYYEDTDLCFRVREQALKVYCQPACTIIHHEGVSSGTDESSGTKRYQAVNRDKFRERWARQLERQPMPPTDHTTTDPVRHQRFHHAKGRALVIDATTPMPDHDSGSVRFTALLELMVEQGWLVSFLPQNLAWEGRYSTALQQAGIEVLTAPAITSLEPWLKQCGADLDLIIVSRHYVLDPIIKLLRKYSPGARIVFDTVDLHFLREQRQAELSGSASMLTAAEHTRRVELGLMMNADTTLVVSPVEQQLLAELVPEADVRVLSNIHSVHGRQRGWRERRDLMFVGGFQHPPNVDAAEWLIEEIFPRIRAELPDAKLHLIGSRMPEALRSKARDGVIMHGFVENLEPYLNGCRLSLAPLRYGAGVKGKVNQAMAWGLPVVATACAAEGMFLVHGQDVLMAEDSEDFAAEVMRAYTDEALWLKLSDGGLANVEKYFSRAAAGRVVKDLLDSVSDRP